MFIQQLEEPDVSVGGGGASNLCTKLTVPSMGSMIQVGLSVSWTRSPAATDSSPMNLGVRGQTTATLSS